MDIQNFRFYLQDATNFFRVHNYILKEDVVEFKPRFFDFIFDEIKNNEKIFYLNENHFVVRVVVDKKDATTTTNAVFNDLFRYYGFLQLRIGNEFARFATGKVGRKNRYTLNVHNGYTTSVPIATLLVHKTKTKAVIEATIITPTVVDFLKSQGFCHEDPEALELMGIDDVVPVVDEAVGIKEQAFLSRRFMFDEIISCDEDGSNIKSALVTKTAREILEEYWGFWSEQMKNRGKDDLITFENCINDYCTENWAWEVDANGNKI
jgi:hypothetical protein